MSSLYLAHFGLNKPPFQITPDLGFFFAGGRRGDILTALLHVAQHEEGIITVVAEVGSGKTLLARLMISRLAPNIATVYLANPSFSRDEILGAIGRDLGLTAMPDATEARLAALQQELLRRHALGQRVLLVIDEAHAMPPDSLEEVRLLSNLETEQHKLINIMLFGQPELDDALAQRQLRQVRDRVVHRFRLMPLPADEAAAYVDHRLRAAGWAGGPLFAPAAMALLIKASGGRARRINLLADKALLGAYAQGLQTVQVPQVRQATNELHDDFASAPTQGTGWGTLRWAAVALVALTAAALGAVAWRLVQKSAATATATLAPTTLTVAAASATTSAMPSLTATVSSPAVVAPAPPNHPQPVAPTTPKTSGAFAALPATGISAPSLAAPEPGAAWIAALAPSLARTQALVQSSDLAGYTLQIAALPREATAATYVQRLAQQIDPALIYTQLSHYNGRDYVAVFVGHYANAAQAQAALADLPVAFKSNNPIPRTWIKIRQDQTS